MFGPFIMIPLGFVIYLWISIVSLWSLIELFAGVGDVLQWVVGPFRRSVVGWIIWGIAVRSFPLAFFIGPGQLFYWLLGLWANLDYYDYWWTDEEGPLAPIPPEEFWGS